MNRQHPHYTLFPYTTLFRSRALAKKLYRSREEPGVHRTISGAENIDKVIRIDQSPIGRTPRSNPATYTGVFARSEEHTSELQSHSDLVCRLLLEKKNKIFIT